MRAEAKILTHQHHRPPQAFNGLPETKRTCNHLIARVPSVPHFSLLHHHKLPVMAGRRKEVPLPAAWYRAMVSGSLVILSCVALLHVRFGLPQETDLSLPQFDMQHRRADRYRGTLMRPARRARRRRPDVVVQDYARYAVPGTELRAGSSGLRLSQRPNTRARAC